MAARMALFLKAEKLCAAVQLQRRCTEWSGLTMSNRSRHFLPLGMNLQNLCQNCHEYCGKVHIEVHSRSSKQHERMILLEWVGAPVVSVAHHTICMTAADTWRQHSWASGHASEVHRVRGLGAVPVYS